MARLAPYARLTNQGKAMNAVMTKSALSLTLAAAIAGPFWVAHADRVGQVDGVPRVVVTYDDLDISHPQGLEELYSRIQTAAMDVCDYDRHPKELARQVRPAACYHAAVDNAIKQVNKPTLTALHHAKAKSVVG
jgi:UrcA family protein